MQQIYTDTDYIFTSTHLSIGLLYQIDTSIGLKWGNIVYQDGKEVLLFIGHSTNPDIPKKEGFCARRAFNEVFTAPRREYEDIREFRAVHKEFFKRLDRKELKQWQK